MRPKATIRKFALSKYIYVLVFLTGAIAFFYPLISSLINYQAQTRVISNYREEVASFDETTLEGFMNDGQLYNQFIASLEGNVTDEITERERSNTNVVYMRVLSTGEAIGNLRIPKLDVELPIYRGTSDDVLNMGVGHLERSSLPIGGESTHSVLMAHRGLPSSRLFRDLNLMKEGDVFFIDSLGMTLAYEVESIRVVLPTEVESLQIREGRDLCTLITCDPYMINSHRLLVTGHRIEYKEELEDIVPQGHINFFQKYYEYFAIVGFFTLLWFMILLIRRRLRRKRAEEDEEYWEPIDG